MTVQSYYDEEVIFAGEDNTYWQAYGLSCDPFSVNEESIDAISSWEDHLDLLFHLSQYNNLVLAIVGESDSGKTTLLNHFQHKVESMQRVVSLNATAHLDPIELLGLISSKLGLEWEDHSDTSLSEKITGIIYAIREEEQSAILLINQAHLLPEKTAQALFDIVAMQSADDKVLGVVVAGEDMLGSMLERVTHEEDKSLLHVFNLKPLSFDETKKYLNFCLQAAGFDGPVPLTERQLKLIHQASEGFLGRIKQETKRIMIAESEKMQSGDNFITRNYLALVSAMMILITSCIYVIGLLHDTEETTTRFVQTTLPAKQATQTLHASLTLPEQKTLNATTLAPKMTKRLARESKLVRLARNDLSQTKSDAPLMMHTQEKTTPAAVSKSTSTIKPASQQAATSAKAPDTLKPPVKKQMPVKPEVASPKQIKPVTSVSKVKQTHMMPVTHPQKPMTVSKKTSTSVPPTPAQKPRQVAPMSRHHGSVNEMHHTLNQLSQLQQRHANKIGVTKTVAKPKANVAPKVVKPKSQPATKVAKQKAKPVVAPSKVKKVAAPSKPKAKVKTVTQMRRSAVPRPASRPRISAHPSSAFADRDLQGLARSLDPDQLDSYTDKSDFDTDYDENSQFRDIKPVKSAYPTKAKATPAEPVAFQSPEPVGPKVTAQIIKTKPRKTSKNTQRKAFKERDITVKPHKKTVARKIYTLQLAAVSSEKKARDFIRENNLTKKATYYKTTRRGKPMVVVVYGRYSASQSAKRAIMTLPKSVQRMKPWPRLQQS